MQERTRGDVTGERGGRPVAAVLAVKGLADAKSRLSQVVPAEPRRALVLAMMADTVVAAWAAGVHDVVVVTPDPVVRRTAGDLGARVVSDVRAIPAAPAVTPLNRAFLRGIADAVSVAPSARVVVLQADLPAMRGAHLAAAIERAQTHDLSMIPDRSGVGTAVLLLGDTAGRTPMFGVESARRHRGAGAVDLTRSPDDIWPDLRADVDTVDDLAVAIALGVGTRTARVLADVGLSGLDTTPRPHAS